MASRHTQGLDQLGPVHARGPGHRERREHIRHAPHNTLAHRAAQSRSMRKIAITLPRLKFMASVARKEGTR